MSNNKLPVTIVSGFLGAGKTTLVNRLLAHRPDLTTGVIVNEFGEVGIDGELIVSDDNALIEIRNGCICCTVRTDLVAAAKTLLDRTDLKLDHLIVETSGLADPAPVLQTFLADADLLEKAELESVVTVVDAANWRRQLDAEIAREQIAFADLVILNKPDLVDDDELQALESALQAINPVAALVRAGTAEAAPERVLGTRRFSLPNVLDIEPGLLRDEHAHEHDQSIGSYSVETGLPLDPDRFNRWANRLVQQHGENLLRMKGILHFEGEARRFHFHSVHMLMDCQPGKRWDAAGTRTSRLVVIGRALPLDALREGFLACVDAAVVA